MALLAAKSKTVGRFKSENPDVGDSTIIGKLVAYASGKFIQWKYSVKSNRKATATISGYSELWNANANAHK